jgi:hypothetical protein
MRRQIRLTTLGGLVIFLATAIAPGQEGKQPDQGSKTPNYYPVEVGNTWHYKVTVNGKDGTITTTVAKHEKVDGTLAARLESPNVNLTEHLMQTEKGVFRYRYKDSDVTPPFKLIAYPPKVGAKWEGAFTVKNEEGKHTYTAEILKEEAVAVPAGKFKALVVQVKLESAGQKIDTTYWFVKDVGFVKQTAAFGNLNILLELERFERKK